MRAKSLQVKGRCGPDELVCLVWLDQGLQQLLQTIDLDAVHCSHSLAQHAFREPLPVKPDQIGLRQVQQ